MKKDEVLEIVKGLYELKSKKEAESKLSEIDTIVKAVADKLEIGDKVNIGKYIQVEYKHVDAKTARNPKTGESISIPEKQVYKVKATKALNRVEE